MDRWFAFSFFAALVGCGGSDDGAVTPANELVDGGDADGSDSADTDSEASAQPDTSSDGAVAKVCSPQPLPADFPPPFVSANRVVGACSTAQLDLHDAACDQSKGGTQAKCQDFYEKNMSCAECMTTMDAQTASAWGPTVAHKRALSFNYGSCIALLDPSQMDCAKKAQAALQCRWAACAGCNVPTDTASLQAYVTCLNATSAAGGPCQAMVNEAFACEFAIGKSSPAIKCFGPAGVQLNFGSGGGTGESFRALATAMCGP